MLNYLIVLLAQILVFMGYIKLASQFHIVDKPNERSSHVDLTIRGGGILFPLGVILWFVLYGLNQPWIVLAVLLLAAVSFFDDVTALSFKLRIVVHFIAVSTLFWQLGIFTLPWYLIIAAYLVTVGWINAFNFMDGINGITVVYSLVALATFGWLNHSIQFISSNLLIILSISILIFAFSNLRKHAKTFAGDVGSITLAFILAWFMIQLMQKTGRFEYILLFSFYGIDTVMTILTRLLHHENIFSAHRNHLYQLLCNELNWSHIKVSALYGAVQGIINLITIVLINSQEMTLLLLLSFLLFLTVVYSFARKLTLKAMKKADHKLTGDANTFIV